MGSEGKLSALVGDRRDRGRLVFYGTMDGWFKAVDARSGELLWRFKVDSGIISQPVSYRGPDGHQYIAVLSGVGGWSGAVVSGPVDPRDGSAALGMVERDVGPSEIHDGWRNALCVLASPLRLRGVSALLRAVGAVTRARTSRQCPREQPDRRRRDRLRADPGVGHSLVTDDPRAAAYYDNADAVNTGKRLFGQYNCIGCHSNGGGGMGPALMDDAWIYGSRLEQIHQTLVDGRPNGMPSWGGKVPDQQLWQLAAYVRSMSLPADTLSADR